METVIVSILTYLILDTVTQPPSSLLQKTFRESKR